MFGINLNPRNDVFFSILEQQSAQAAEAARLLCDLVNDFTNVEAKLQLLVDAEKKADTINHEMVQQLSKTFVTPIDREDLHNLAFAIDDIVDNIEAAGTTMVLCKVKVVTPYAVKMANIVLDASAKLNALMPNLRSMRDARQQYIAIHTLENEGDDLWQQAFASLFEDGSNPLEVIKWKEIYEMMEESIDSIERVAEIIEEVIQKMDSGLLFLIAIIIVAVGFDYINGFHDTANAIATVVSTRVLSPLAAVAMAAFFNFIGAFTGTQVAKTVGADIVDPSNSNQTIVICSLLAAIIWNLITWWLGLPSSSSHALIGGLIGAGLAGNGFRIDVIKGDGVGKVIIGLIVSPIAGFIIGYFVMIALNWLLIKATPHFVNKWFRRLQLFSAAFMAFSHGGNDAQKTMGIITLAILTYEGRPGNTFQVPIWVILLAASAMAAGTASGGWRIIKTMGSKIVDLKPIHGFAAETSAATVIETASRLGFPVSTTHVISTAIVGVGASRRLSAVRWSTVGNIVKAWVFTIPVCIILGIVIESLFSLVF